MLAEGIRIVMLAGDSEPTAKAVATRLGIYEVVAGAACILFQKSGGIPNVVIAVNTMSRRNGLSFLL
ncbi:hypothetical protein C9I57_31780 [Trinickia symbiotica]|uniref:Uncharacterized protein n=1 Tax=Trinickia symbiotica TaxID=863227 RepID=A0A2T3XJR8_9BURK|nr:hypothetical protein C9I57_31780 [Trinickia symbiotica]